MQHSFTDQLSMEVKSILTGYPKFVFSNNSETNLDGIPVFVHHTIDPEIFESQLIFLKANGYKTLSIQEFYDSLKKSKSLSGRSVLLTIDDARSSVWRYAFPLLKKYKMKATVFIIPGWTNDSAFLRKNLFDIWNGRSSLKEIERIDPVDRTLCTWNELSEMYNSGLINIESHTLFHREIFLNNTIKDFFISDESFIPYNFSASPYLRIEDSEKEIKIEDFLGLPIFESSPLLSAKEQMVPSIKFKDLCREIYIKKKSYLTSLGWQDEIRKLLAIHSTDSDFFSMKLEPNEIISEDLNLARDLIQTRLDIHAGNHLCLPWTIGSYEAVNIIKKLGIKSCFWGVLPNKKINRPGDDLYFITRIKNDFIFRLPGKNRKSFFSIYKNKIKRRLYRGKVF